MATFTVEPTLTPTLPETPTETPTAELAPTATLAETPTETATSELLTPLPTLTETLTETPTATLTPTAFASPFGAEPPLSLIFADNFDAGETLLWTLGAGWTFVASESGQALQATSDDAATFANNNVSDAAAEARFLLPSGLARLSLRQSEAGSYTALMDVSGNIVLYRGGEQLGTALVSPLAPSQWRTLRLSAIGDIVRVSIDGVEMIAAQDIVPLPPGTISFAGIGANGLLVDDFGLWVIGGIINTPTQTPVAMPPDPPTPTPTSTISQNDAFEDSLAIMGFVSPSEPYAVASTLPEFQAAIDAANMSSVPYSIFLKKATFSIPSRINIGSDSATRNIRIYGLGSEVSIIDSEISGETLFYVYTGSTLLLKDLTLTGGNSGIAYGGMIVNFGIVELNGTVIRNNTATYGGGAIFNQFATTIIKNSIFKLNATTDISSGIAGAIYDYGGTVTVSCTSFDTNSTPNTGGAIQNSASGSTTVTNSMFIGNTAPAFGGGAIARTSGSVTANGNYWPTWNGNPPGTSNPYFPTTPSMDTLYFMSTPTSIRLSNPMDDRGLCPDIPPRTATPTFEQELADYGITITETEWPGYTSAVLDGVHNTAIALAIQSLSVPSTDDAPRATFKRVMVNLTFDRVDLGVNQQGQEKKYCITNPVSSTITCDDDAVPTHYTITHELGHMFNERAGGRDNGSGSLFDRLDEVYNTIKDYRPIDGDRRIVFGSVTIADRVLDWQRGLRGWGSRSVTPWACDGSSGSTPSNFQQNPCNIPKDTNVDEGDEIEEGAADMFLNWVYRKLEEGGFLNKRWTGSCFPNGCDDSYSPGNIRMDWVDESMASLFSYYNW